MTKQELNRDIKRLLKMEATDKDGNLSKEFKAEYTRLFYADNEFEWTSAKSIKIMLRLNVKHRIIPLHRFGLMIEL